MTFGRFGRGRKDNEALPQHTDPVTRASVALETGQIPSPQDKFLLLCMHRTQHHVDVAQTVLEDIDTDRQLFRFLKA